MFQISASLTLLSLAIRNPPYCVPSPQLPRPHLAPAIFIPVIKLLWSLPCPGNSERHKLRVSARLERTFFPTQQILATENNASSVASGIRVLEQTETRPKGTSANIDLPVFRIGGKEGGDGVCHPRPAGRRKEVSKRKYDCAELRFDITHSC